MQILIKCCWNVTHWSVVWKEKNTPTCDWCLTVAVYFYWLMSRCSFLIGSFSQFCYWSFLRIKQIAEKHKMQQSFKACRKSREFISQSYNLFMNSPIGSIWWCAKFGILSDSLRFFGIIFTYIFLELYIFSQVEVANFEDSLRFVTLIQERFVRVIEIELFIIDSLSLGFLGGWNQFKVLEIN